MLTKELYDKYVQILSEELVPAMGCTEPIAIAYAGAKARQVLGEEPIKAIIEVSGNIIKNVKSVIVPHTGGLRGIEAALAAGLAVGDADAVLEVLSGVKEDEVGLIKSFMERCEIKVLKSSGQCVFEIVVRLTGKNHNSYIKLTETHTNVVCIMKDGQILYENNTIAQVKKEDRSCLSVENIVEFASTVKISDVEKIIDRQIEYNMAIANEGITNNYGANVGKVYLKAFPNDVKIKAKAFASAGSDARMNGCEMPVIINSGSGNQGITASVPVIIYAKENGIDREKLIRALVVSNLVTVHLKTGVGTLSAYCGVVSAGAGAGAGISYLLGGDYAEIAHTVVNALAIDSGVICDGAKGSCAAKIAIAVESGILGLEMYKLGNEFMSGDGIVKKGVERTIESVSKVASQGMKETDQEIIRIMTEDL